MHEVLDMERWRREFPLEAHDAQIVTQSKTWRTRDPKRFPDQKAVDEWLERRLGPTLRTIIGPSDIAIVEQWRERYEMDSRATTMAPTDVFIWALGEPPDARMTKIGGLPFWPAGSEWPLDERRDPMQFVAQLCFMDSRDL